MDQASKNRLAKVHPELARRVEKTIDLLAAAGLDVRVVQGLRSYAEQEALFQQGRTRKGPKVTNARGGQSNHNFGLAVDLCPFGDGSADWDNDPGFTLIGKAAKTQGLEWGGDWDSFPDRPHVQLKTGLETSVCHELFVQGKGSLEVLWREASRRIGVAPVPAQKIAAAEPHVQIPPIETPANAVEHREAASEVPAVPAHQPDQSPLPNQTAENITNVNAGGVAGVPADFVPEDKTVDAPPKEGSTAKAATVTVLGFAVPTVLAGVVSAIQSAMRDGYISASQVGDVVLSFISNNQKYVFVGLGLIIGNMMLKKAYRQITLWLSMWFASRPDRHNVTAKPQ
ncbi:MAG: M15 family metallopeptidase [Pyrinomonadaceae bacterium]